MAGEQVIDHAAVGLADPGMQQGGRPRAYPATWPWPTAVRILGWVMGTKEILAEQVAYYRARAPEYDDWWERRRGYDLGEQATSAWRADAALLRDALDGFAPRGQVLELAADTGIWTGELLRHADRVLVVGAASGRQGGLTTA